MVNFMQKENIFNGFLKTQGTKIINDAGQEVLLTGWGLGNWLLCEGYMWLSDGSARFDRPHRIEQVVKELIGETASKSFWQSFRENYITEADIKHLKDLGYNSVRIPFNWRLFLEDEPGVIWKEDGFELVDKCVKWCEKHELYAFLDLHGAPGGQTGANIDDCVDDVPRLFMDDDKWQKGIALWEELAKRYKDNPVIGGYDLLNEPIRPSHGDMVDYDYLLPQLVKFYEEAIKVIRKHDPHHLISIEGHHWATSMGVFDRKYDDNMVIHFHRYACYPERKSLDEWLALSKKWQAPLWLGETGENKIEWFSAFFPLCLDYGIGYNLWPYKKMGRENCPITIKTPKDWELIINYSKGDAHPGYFKATQILNEYLENMKFENCQLNQTMTHHVFRQVPYGVRATDFDEKASGASAFYGRNMNTKENDFNYRVGTGLKIVEEWPIGEKKFAFDTQWDRFLLKLNEEEFVTYSVGRVENGNKVVFKGLMPNEAQIEVSFNGENHQVAKVEKANQETGEFILEFPLIPAERMEVRIKVLHGSIHLRTVDFK